MRLTIAQKMEPALIKKRRILSIQKNLLLTYPQSIRLDITSVCNLNCNYCWVHSPLEKKNPSAKFMPFPMIEHIFKTATLWRLCDISLSGDGEPTLHPYFKDIVNLAQQNMLPLTLTTNATFDSSLLKTVSLIPELLINVSAPTKELYHDIQSPYNAQTYDQVLHNLHILSELSKHHRTPHLHFVSILNKTNVNYVPELLNMAKKFNAKRISFRIMDPTENTQCLNLNDEHKNNLITIIDKILKHKSSVPHNLYDIKQELQTPSSSAYHLQHCYVGWFMLFINLNLDVGFCCHNESILFDNLNQHSLEEIWKSKKAHQLRLLCKNHFDVQRPPFKGECEWCYWYQENQQVHHDVHQSRIS